MLGIKSLSVKSYPWGALSLNSKMMLQMFGRAQSIISLFFLNGKPIVNTNKEQKKNKTERITENKPGNS